jgi:hypothetical protein
MPSACVTTLGDQQGTTPAMQASPRFADDMAPRVVLPVTGGPPVVGIPVGGSLYLPVTGGPPVVGIPVAP